MSEVDTRPRREQLREFMRAAGPASSADLVLMTGWTRLMVTDALRILRRKKQIHITAYERQPDGQKGRCIPIYLEGEGEDAPPLKQVGRKEVNRKYRQRHAALVSLRRYPQVRQSLGPWAGL